MIRHVIYLHGFLSSPASSKAQRFARELATCGAGFSCPDLNSPGFETLTVTRMLAQTHDAIAAAGEASIALIGSSLGGFVAVHAAAREPAVERLVLLAPTFDFGGNRLRQLGDRGIEDWRAAGRLRVFHHAWNEYRDIDFGLYEDASHYDAFGLDISVPTLIVQGTRDEVVDPVMIQEWAALRPTVDLRLVDDDHQLGASMDQMWRWTRAFLE